MEGGQIREVLILPGGVRAAMNSEAGSPRAFPATFDTDGDMYECHLTFEDVGPELQAKLEIFAELHNWKTSFIDGDPALGPGKRLFLTSHDEDGQTLLRRMHHAALTAPAMPVRQKIEHIVHDTKYGLIMGQRS